MNERFHQLLDEFKKLGLPDDQYAIYGSGPMGIRNIREVNDLDVIVSAELYQELKKKYSKDSEKERIKIGEIEIYPVWAWSNIGNLDEVLRRAELIEGLRFTLLDDLLECKKKMGRLKDDKDIRLIEEFLET